MSLSIEKESEDILAQEKDEEDESLSEDDEEEELDGYDCERKAAAALTSLVGSRLEPEQAKTMAQTGASNDFTIPLRFTKSGRKRAVPFPMKLMKVLTEEKNSDIISWMPSGKSFVVHKPKVFVAQILGRVFKSAKYSSFTRKLHRWGFNRHYRGEEAGSFYHEFFQKDRLDLCEQMTCHKNEPISKAQSLIKKAKAAPVAIAPQLQREVIIQRSVAAALHQDYSPRSSATGSVVTAPRMVQRPPTASFEMPSSAPAMQHPNAAAADLNAAIEMEVSRRLKERINQAALSRQALLVMQQQEAKARQEQQLRYQLAMLQQQQQQRQQYQHQQQQQQQHMQQQQRLQQQPPQQQLGLGPNVTAGLVRHLAALKFGPSSSFKPNTSPNFQQAFGNSAMGLPPTNIQGAKTA